MTALDPRQLIEHRVYRGGELEPVKGALYRYWLAGNGLFVQAESSVMSAVVTAVPMLVRGLPRLTPRVEFRPLPVKFLETLIAHGRHFPQQEVTYQVVRDGSGRVSLRLVQVGTKASSGDFRDLAGTVIAQIHTHNSMSAFWSTTDNAHEVEFRWYAVVGKIDRQTPEIAVRVGVYGYWLQLPVARLFGGSANNLVADVGVKL